MEKVKPLTEDKKLNAWWSKFISRMKEKGALLSDETALKIRQQQLFKHTQSNDQQRN
jgi:hypothetical protein